MIRSDGKSHGKIHNIGLSRAGDQQSADPLEQVE